MKVTFFSNFMNHHQLPFCLEMVNIFGENFKFVATTKIDDERIKLGYEDMNKKYDFIVRAYEGEEKAMQLGQDSDIVIIGSAPDKYIKRRIKDRKITFRYSERVYKNGFKIKSFLSILINRTIKEKNKVYLLCASAYSANDYNMAGAYKNKCYKWGYFPKVIKYDNIQEVISRKKDKSVLWVARFIDWKHPEIPIKLAKKLKESGYEFSINMIGTGKLENKIEKLIKENNLSNNVKLLGAMPSNKVRKYMEESKIFICTSDRGEGWGAVLNEAMNSACALVASHEIGSVPFLIKDKENGLIYENGNIEDLYNKVKVLLDNNQLCDNYGKKAYETMLNIWNPKIATERFIKLARELQNDKVCTLFEEGPCSRAERIRDNWR